MIYDVVHAIIRFIMTILFRPKIYGLENLPDSGPVIIASNHISNFDPPLIACFIPSQRPVNYMAKDELFFNAFMRWLWKNLHAFPVKRGMADRNAIRTAISILQSGNIVGLFPEGTRSKTGKLGKPEPGIAMIAIKAKAVIVPCALAGTNRIFTRGCLFPQLSMSLGKPIIFECVKADKATIESLGEKIMQEIKMLLENNNHASN